MSLGGRPALTVAGTVVQVVSSFVVSNHSGKFLGSFFPDPDPAPVSRLLKSCRVPIQSWKWVRSQVPR